MDERLSLKEMELIATKLSGEPYDGYPRQEQRLTLAQVALYEGRLLVPDGEWSITNHENRRGVNPCSMDHEVPSEASPHMPLELMHQWQAMDLLLDQYDRPIHPDWKQLLADPRTALPTGLGFFYRYGPNKTVDPVIYRKHSGKTPLELLLIRRQKGGQWALPGGFLDRDDESPAAGARREAQEETVLDAIGGTDESIIKRRPIGRRTTLHSWTENEVILIHGDQSYLYEATPQAGDDAIDVGWFTLDHIQRLAIFDDHMSYIDEAVVRIMKLLKSQ